MSALDLLVRTIKSQKFNRPFYSKVDEALEKLPRQKGTAEEFLRELEKQPGVKKAEIEDRGIRKALANRAMAPDAKKPITKERMQKILYDQAPFPPVVEDVLGGKNVKYQKWSTPGGKNYREILLKLPEDYLNDPFVSDHYGDTPNILAHIRVSDYEIPNKGFLVVNTKSGNKSEAFKTAEEAQAYLDNMPESMRPSLKITEGQGTPKKVLLVDEIQSDWHQAGRSEGYKTGKEKAQGQILSKEYDALVQRRRDLLKQAEEMPDGGEKFAALIDEANDITPQLMRMQTQMDELRSAAYRGVPDAPFKKNWHELAMKRVLDYAAGKGYDTIAITPGAEQVKRYDLSKELDKVLYSPYGDGTFEVSAVLPNGREFGQVAGRKTIEEIEKTFGKEIAQKITKGEKTGEESGVNFLSGEGLQVGGEGQIGFYDKILPDYLNNYGKKYGAQMSEIHLKTGEEMSRGPTGSDMVPSYSPTMQTFHALDITPQMRAEINTKGQPLYGKVAMPVLEGMAAGSGAATIGSQVFGGDNEQDVQNPIHFSENPDAMRLELMQSNQIE